jgi:Zn-dependent peptidase ImmA (M78 family)
METPSVKWLDKSVIEDAAWDFLKENNSHRSIPIDVELIAEKNGIDIIEIPNLQRRLGIDGFITKDFTSICVDQMTSQNVPVRCRFTVAHELGHMVLHSDVYSKIGFSSVEEWIDFQDTINGKVHGYIETQGYIFAGCLLAPKILLDERFNDVLPNVLPQIHDVKSRGITRDAYLDYAVSMLSAQIAPMFDVSQEVINKRIKDRSDFLMLIP